MLRRYIYYLFSILIVFNFWSLSAIHADSEKVGTSSGLFLSIEPDARGSSLGGAMVSFSDDSSASYWNPAGLSYMNGSSLMATHSEWLSSINYEFFSAGKNYDQFGSIGFHFIYLYKGDLIEKDIFGNKSGTLMSYANLAIGLSFSRSFLNLFSVGITTKYIQQKVYQDYSSSFSFDGGIIIEPFTRLKIGIGAYNFASVGIFENVKDPLNYNLRLGVSYSLPLKVSMINRLNLLGGTDYDYSDGMVYRLGLEPEIGLFQKKLKLFFRSGIKISESNMNFSFGTGNISFGSGIIYKNFGVDYTLKPFGDLGYIHYVTLSYKGSVSRKEEEEEL